MEAAGSCINHAGVAHGLSRNGSIQKLLVDTHVAHGRLGFEMRSHSHIRNDEIETPVVIQICGIGAHRIPARVGSSQSDHIGEGPIPVIQIKLIWIGKVITNIEIHVPIVVVIIPSAGKPKSALLNPRLL